MNKLQKDFATCYEVLASAASVYGSVDEKLYVQVLDAMEELCIVAAEHSNALSGAGLPQPGHVEPPLYASGMTVVEDGKLILEKMWSLYESIPEIHARLIRASNRSDATSAMHGLRKRFSGLAGAFQRSRASLYIRQMNKVIPSEYRIALFHGTGMTMNVIAQARGALAIYEAGVTAEYANASADLTHLEDETTARIIACWRDGVPVEYVRELV